MKKVIVIAFAVFLSFGLFSGVVCAASGGHGGGGHGGGGFHGGGGWHGGGWHGGGWHGWGWRGGFYYRPYWGWYGWGPWWGYPYGYPYYGYPYSYPYAYSYPTYPAPDAQLPVPSEPQQSYWYYCQDPQGYYPYVKNCPGGWTQVVPTPPPSGKEGIAP